MTTEEKTTEEKTTEEKTTEEKTTEEKTTEEKTTEEKREETIENYIDHIRNMSEITDEEMESVLDEVIEEDEELLDILAKLSSKIEKISDKIIVIIAEKEDGGREKEKDESHEIDDILEAFGDADCAYPLEDIIDSLKDSGYADPGTIIVDAITDGILCVDSIEEDETIYIALTKEGESLWESCN